MRQISLLMVAGVALLSMVGCSDDTVAAPTCTKNADCLLKALPVCDVTSGKCVASAVDSGPTDGGADGDMNKTDTLPPDGMPPDTLKPDLLKQLGTICGNGTECISGKCTNNVCCSVASCDPCKRCNAEGKCANSDSAGNTAGDCKGSESACDGTCKAGACDFPTDDCGTVCNSTDPTARDTKICDKGTCKLTMAVACAAPPTFPPYTLCLPPSGSPPAATCAKGCTKHTDCAGGAKALCDRTNAHDDPNGLGQCVNPSEVLVVSNSTNLEAAVNAATPSPWIKASAGTYSTIALSVGGSKTVRIAGDGAVKLEGTGGTPIFSVSGTAKLALQGVTLQLAGSGVLCNATAAQVTLVESTVMGTSGIGIHAVLGCNVTVRRSTISSNSQGGLSLASGTFTITNTLIRNNGTAGSSDIGGVSFGASSTVVFQHNTVVFNATKTTKTAGIKCDGGEAIEHSIIASNNGVGETLACALGTTTVTDTSCLVSSYKPTASACFNKSSTTLKLDRDSQPRIKGTSADLGCYEVQ